MEVLFAEDKNKIEPENRLKNKKKNIEDLIKSQKDKINNSNLKGYPMNYEELVIQRDKNEESELTKAKSEIDKINLKDQLFAHYLKYIQKENLNPEENKFKDIEEHWGFWLNNITSKIKEAKDDPKKEFNQWLESYKKNKNFNNLGFLCNDIQKNIENNNYIQDNYESFGAAFFNNIKNFFVTKNNPDIKKIEEIRDKLSQPNILNNNSSFIPYYYLGISYLFLKDKDKGLEYLEKSKKLIEIEYNYYINFLINSKTYEKYRKIMTKKINALSSIQLSLINPIIDNLKNNKNFKLKKTTSDIYFKNFDNYEDFFDELKFKGFYYIFICNDTGILSFISGFFVKLFHNITHELKELFDIKEIRNLFLKKVLKEDKNTNQEEKDGKKRGLLNSFLEKIKIVFYDTIFEPNFDPDKREEIRAKEIKDSDIYKKILEDYKEQLEEILDNNFNEINYNFDELLYKEQDIQIFVKELNDEIIQKTQLKLLNDKNYLDAKKDLEICNDADIILNNMKIYFKNLKMSNSLGIGEEISFDNFQRLAEKYSEQHYKNIIGCYLNQKDNINKSCLNKFNKIAKEVTQNEIEKIREKAKLLNNHQQSQANTKEAPKEKEFDTQKESKKNNENQSNVNNGDKNEHNAQQNQKIDGENNINIEEESEVSEEAKLDDKTKNQKNNINNDAQSKGSENQTLKQQETELSNEKQKKEADEQLK